MFDESEYAIFALIQASWVYDREAAIFASDTVCESSIVTVTMYMYNELFFVRLDEVAQAS